MPDGGLVLIAEKLIGVFDMKNLQKNLQKIRR
jgi:hypothetical protein